MSVRMIVMVAVAVAAAAVVIMTTRDNHKTGDKPLATVPSQVSNRRDRPRPSLEVPAPPPTTARPRPQLALPADLPVFSREARDSAWAPVQETAVRKRVDELLGDSPTRVSNLECRTHQCRFEVSGPASEFTSFVELVQGSDGFRNDAAQLMLQDYDAAADGGAASVTVVLFYGRAAESSADESVSRDR